MSPVAADARSRSELRPELVLDERVIVLVFVENPSTDIPTSAHGSIAAGALLSIAAGLSDSPSDDVVPLPVRRMLPGANARTQYLRVQ